MSRSGLWAFLLATLSTAACKSGRPLPIIGADIPARSAERIMEQALRHEQGPIPYYSAKASVSIKLPDANRSFKAQIRSVQDSATWISVIPALGIEVARVMLTSDSLFFLDRLADQYFAGDTAAAAIKFGVRPSLQLLQQALLGRAIGLDPEEKYRSDRDEGQYLLTSREKRRFVRAADEVTPVDTLAREPGMPERRLERTLRKAEEKEAIVMRYWFEPDSFRVTRVQIADLVRDQSADVRYEERGDAEEGNLPTSIRITLSEPGRQVSGTFELSRISTTGPLQMSFKIPEKFTPMP